MTDGSVLAAWFWAAFPDFQGEYIVAGVQLPMAVEK